MGVPIDSYDYTAYGAGEPSVGTVPNLYQFVGELGYSADNPHLLYIRRRWYLTFLGRWASRDVIPLPGRKLLRNLRPEAGFIFSPYRYVQNNPINGADPSGLVEVMIQADAFIPDAWIWMGSPLLQLKGDNRSWMLSPPPASKSRVTSYIKIETNECVSKDPLLSRSNFVSESTRVLFGITQSALGKSVGVEEVRRTGPRRVVVTVRASSWIPQVLVPLAPHIDYNYTIVIDEQCDGTIKYTLKGDHDGFPAYEVFIHGRLVHQSNPANFFDLINNPLALYGTSDVPVLKEGRLPSDHFAIPSSCVKQR